MIMRQCCKVILICHQRYLYKFFVLCFSFNTFAQKSVFLLSTGDAAVGPTLCTCFVIYSKLFVGCIFTCVGIMVKSPIEHAALGPCSAWVGGKYSLVTCCNIGRPYIK